MKKILIPMLISCGGVLDKEKTFHNINNRYGVKYSEKELFDVLFGKNDFCRGIYISNYYGSHLDASAIQTKQCIKDLIANGINWDLTTELRDIEQSHFQGTDQDSSRAYYSYAKVVSNSGNIYLWGVSGNLNEISGFLNKISTIFNIDSVSPKVTLEDALESALERIEIFENKYASDQKKYYKDTWFGYECCWGAHQ